MVTGAEINDSGDADSMDAVVAMTRANAGEERRAREAADGGALRFSVVLFRVFRPFRRSLPLVPFFAS